ncbi:MAG: amino acid ABC transporter permease [Coriobacteriia bacterium]|nr:amino acid ABC transporter permease [Coriobacteriia bacterium]
MGELFTWINFKFLLEGLLLTIVISLVSILLSLVIGTVLALMRRSHNSLLAALATIYIEVFKNTPLLLWIMFIFFIVQLPPIPSAIAAFTVFTSASMGEIIRGGLSGVHRGQYEAMRSQGFSRFQGYTYIIMPQALKNMVPALLSQAITTIKDTSFLWSAIAIQELMGRGMILMNNYNSTLQIFTIFALVGLFYFIICFALSLGVRRYQKKYKIPGRVGV